MKIISQTSSTIAISKSPLLALLSNGGNTTNPSWSVPNAGFSANENLVDVISCSTVTADGSGGVQISSTGGLPIVCNLFSFQGDQTVLPNLQVLLPQSSLGGSGLCGASKSSTKNNGARSSMSTSSFTALLGIFSVILLIL